MNATFSWRTEALRTRGFEATGQLFRQQEARRAETVKMMELTHAAQRSISADHMSFLPQEFSKGQGRAFL